MTQEQMISEIQQQEAQLYLSVKLVERDFGRHSDLYTMARSKWVGVNDLMKALGIEHDLSLPQVAQALAIDRYLD